ncbi:hypothetical protein CEUSTIGMA_g3281.t1 [Chlamydomonas eustigma]|uniref:Uncharacterized protein n=1 Tax=Chlamydomonas eustigma TaxID=1157962 RepID=A0A250WYB1_9CHLO|nr:hypothetical protein CEUSTIGMA_g3281.t1 [Chlamydomonas eustigma]|eukprot:GAX75838.1 hypothetical protein CEUSTIGMA_g3281.t1 [Chlamydomonas eustigma]
MAWHSKAGEIDFPFQRSWDTKTWGSMSSRVKSFEEVKHDFSDIILPEDLHSNVRLLASAASNTRKHGAPFRHMLFYIALLVLARPRQLSVLLAPVVWTMRSCQGVMLHLWPARQ